MKFPNSNERVLGRSTRGYEAADPDIRQVTQAGVERVDRPEVGVQGQFGHARHIMCVSLPARPPLSSPARDPRCFSLASVPLTDCLAALSRKSLASRMSSSYAGWPQGSVGWRRARERTRAATQRTSASAQAARLSSAGRSGRPSTAVRCGRRTSLSLRGRLWTLTYVYGTVFARLGGVAMDLHSKVT